MNDKMINVKFESKTLEKIGSESKRIGMSKSGFIRMVIMKYLDKIKSEHFGKD